MGNVAPTIDPARRRYSFSLSDSDLYPLCFWERRPATVGRAFRSTYISPLQPSFTRPAVCQLHLADVGGGDALLFARVHALLPPRICIGDQRSGLGRIPCVGCVLSKFFK